MTRVVPTHWELWERDPAAEVSPREEMEEEMEASWPASLVSSRIISSQVSRASISSSNSQKTLILGYG